MHINAPLPLNWTRTYSSDNDKIGVLGQGWSLWLELSFKIEKDEIIFKDLYAREIKFDTLEVEEESFFPLEQLTLKRVETSKYTLTTVDGLIFIFQSIRDDNYYTLSGMQDINDNQLTFITNLAIEQITFISTDDNRLFEIEYINHRRVGLRVSGVVEHIVNIEVAEKKVIQTKNGKKLLLDYRDEDSKIRLKNIQSHTIKEESKDLENIKIKRHFSYQYSIDGDLISVNDAQEDITRTFTYTNHIMTSHKVPNGLESFYEYDNYTPKGKVTLNHTNTGELWRLDYQANKTIVIDKLEREEIHIFDEDKYLIELIDPLSQSTKIEYNQDGLIQKVIDKAGQTKEYIRDTRGNPTLITDTDGTKTKISYHNKFNKPIEIVDDLGNTTKLEYDYRANLTSQTLPNEATSKYIRQKDGLPISIVDPLGGATSLTYDKRGNLLQHIDPLGKTTEYKYDAESNIIEAIDAVENITKYTYDKKQQLTHIKYPNSSIEEFKYNSLGQLTTYIDPKGDQTTYKLDTTGKLTKKINAIGDSLEYNYDEVGRLTTLINENKEQYHFQYDPLDRLIQEQGLDGIITKYDYNKNNSINKKREITPNSTKRVTQYNRDTTGKLNSKVIDNKSQTDYQYDILGQLIESSNSNSNVKFSYDSMGQITTENIKSILAKEQTLQHSYDIMGNKIETILPDNRVLNWSYNKIGALEKIEIDGKTITNYERDDLYQEISKTQGALQSLSEYDSLGRLISQTTNKTETTTNHIPNPKEQLLKRVYSYDKVGNLTNISDSRVGDTTYNYDNIGRVTKTVTPNKTELFSFDPAHNLIDPDNPKDKIKHNKIETYQDKRYKYDEFGNVVNKKISNHTNIDLFYDSQHQLNRSIVTKNSITKTYLYSYDPFGRRITKEDEDGTTLFMWDGNRLLNENRDLITQTYIYEQFGFTPVASLDDKNSINYYHTDHLGTPRELTDEKGEIVWEAEYDTWGNIKESSKSNDGIILVQPLRFQGQYHDTETGLYYNRFRYYDPDIGRFVSQDPIGLIGGTNLYAYAPNPISWIDPLGLAKKSKVVYRQLTAEDGQRLSEGKNILPHGTGGSILDHVDGKSTNHISASETAKATQRFDSGNGMAVIDVDKATKGSTNFIDHNNVVQGTKKGTLQNKRDAKRAEEVLFKGNEGIPCDSVIDIKN